MGIIEKINCITFNKPNSIAIDYGEEKITYSKLGKKSNEIADLLLNRLKERKNVLVFMDRGPNLIASLLGIMKAGGVFVPIDPQLPSARVELIMKEIDSDWTIANVKWLSKLNSIAESNNNKMNVIVPDLYEDLNEKFINLNIYSLVDVKEISNESYIENKYNYIYFTSGSTGKPKGILGRSRSLEHFIDWEIEEFGVNENFKISQFTPISFDPFLRDVFVALCSGATLCIPENEDLILNAKKLIEWINNKSITLIHTVPSVFKLMSTQLSKEIIFDKLKYILLAGELLRGNDVSKFVNIYGQKVQLVNLYGPTETTLAKFFYRVQEADVNKSIIPVGKPIRNTQYLVLNKDMNICNVGIEGEVYIRTPYISAGYYNNKEFTKDVFIKNPFSDNERDIIYKTGDLGRILIDGNLELLGRKDNQVKIRGMRIEVREIENILLQHDMISEAIVTDRNDDSDDDKYLCVYIVCNQDVNKIEIKNYLSDRLPRNMIPKYFIYLNKVPLTHNGKIDRKRLPEPKVSDLIISEYEGARNDTEEKLIEIWREILHVERVGINDSFFELGGHSLKATTLVSKIHKELNVEIPLREIFKCPTIKGISKYIEKTEKSIYSSIETVEQKEYYEASSAQKRMYMLQQIDLDSTAYNMPRLIVVEGRLNIEKLERSFEELIRRHETLRTSFEAVEDKIVQKINESVNFKLDYFEVGCIENQAKVVDGIVKDFIKAFNLSKAPLLRVGLIKLEEDKHMLMFDMHHIISDGVSMGIVINEFSKIYEGNKLEQLRIQYKDYSQWQNNLLKSDIMQKQREYWISTFKGEIPVLKIPADYVRPVIQSFEGHNISLKIDSELTKGLKDISKDSGSTMYMTLLSAINILLSKYSGQEDIVVGSTIAGRTHADIEKIIGMFVNTLAMRNYPKGSKTYKEFLNEVRRNALNAYENQDYQFEELVDKLNITRDTSRNPIFDVMFTMQNVDETDIELKDLKIKHYGHKNKVAKFDLTFTAVEENDEVNISVNYRTKLYKKETVERMAEHLKNILKTIVNNIDIKLDDIEMLTEEEKYKLLYEFNNTYADYPRDKTIQELFENQVEKTPDNIAVMFEDKKLTYRELNKKSNSLARVLRGKGVKADSIVVIMVERSLEMIVGIMGILKAGGAYLPIDPNYPKERIKYMLNDSKSNILLSKNDLVENLKFTGEVIDLSNEKIFKNDSTNLEKINKSKNLAYAIYTSGTTGNPKGVMIEHKQVNNFIKGIVKETNLNLYSNILCITTICFDIFGLETLVPLTKGLNIVVANRKEQIDGDKLSEVITKNNVEVMQSTPSRLKVLLENKSFKESIRDLKLLLIGGEEVDDILVMKLHDSINAKIYNVYGPSETTIWSTARELKKNEKVTIGKPISNTKIYILNKNNQLLPVGIAGELCISGDGLARGYVNRQELTAEKFVDNPFELGTKMYKTGDLARWLPDGNIEFLGRIDNQVKIRGFRIELGEIENRLLQHEGVKEVAVLVKENKEKEKYICAYVVSEKSLEDLDLKGHLRETLPEYMVPAYIVELEKMPVTANGKLDRRALPEPNLNANLAEYEAPKNEVEEILVKIWSEVLGVEKVGTNDNFFDLGGHSLKATILMSKIHKELNKEIPLKELFKSPTIKNLSKYIEYVEENPYSKIERVEEKECYETSSAQKRMYMLQQFDKDSTAYNMPVVFELEGKVDKDRIEETFRKLVERHEALRTYFETLNGKIIQKLQRDYKFNLVCRNESENVEYTIKTFVRPFDLEKAPLLRVELVESKEKTYLLIDMHHIISDGVSMGILINEFTEIYSGKTLELLKLQYKDFAAWQNNFLKSEEMKKQEEYWINRFSDEIPVLNIPTDYKRPAMQSFEGDSISFEVDEDTTLKLRKLTKETGTTMHMVLLSAFNILLSKYSGQEDIVVGTPIDGRPHVDLHNIVGVFVNTLALRNKPKGYKKYIDFLMEVKENSLNAYENQSYQLEALVEKLDVRRDTSRNPLFDVIFNSTNAFDEDEKILDELLIRPYHMKVNKSKVDFQLALEEKLKTISLVLIYSTNLYDKNTIEIMIEDYIDILEMIVMDKEMSVDSIILKCSEKYFDDTSELEILAEQFNI